MRSEWKIKQVIGLMQIFNFCGLMIKSADSSFWLIFQGLRLEVFVRKVNKKPPLLAEVKKFA